MGQRQSLSEVDGVFPEGLLQSVVQTAVWRPLQDREGFGGGRCDLLCLGGLR
jgi:hypothetical protein